MSENSITVIKPYQWEGLWVFDDDRVGLDKEPFVAGADTLIDLAIERKGILITKQSAARAYTKKAARGCRAAWG